MKKIFNLLLLPLLWIIACSEVSKVTFKEIEPATLITLAQTNFEIQDNDKGLFTLKWNPAKITFDGASNIMAGPVLYTIEAAEKNTNFSPKIQLGTSSVDSFVVKNDVLNDLLQSNLEYPAMTASDVEFRVTTSYGDPSLAQNIASKTIMLNIKTNKVPYPKDLFMIGGGIDADSWSSANVRTLTGVHSADHAFFTIIYIKANEWIKFNSKKDWNGKDFGKTGDMDSNNAFAFGGDNVEVTTDGIYVVYVDLKTKKIELTPAQDYILVTENAFTGGDAGQYFCTVDNTTKKVTTPAATATADLRIYATSKLAKADGVAWWKMEFVPIEGKIVFRGRGDDQARKTINVGQTCIMDFTALTATIE